MIIEITPNLFISAKQIEIQKHRTNKIFFIIYTEEQNDITIESDTIVNCKFENFYLQENFKIENCWNINLNNINKIILYGEAIQ